MKHANTMQSHALRTLALSVLTVAVLGGCAAKNPALDLPAFKFPKRFYTGSEGAEAGAQDTSKSLAELGWKHIYTDAPLQQLIAQALDAGPDALLAAARVREAQALASAVRSGVCASKILNSDKSPCTTPAHNMRTTSAISAAWCCRACAGVKDTSFNRGAASPCASVTNSINSTPSKKLYGFGTRTPAAANR